MMLPKGPFQLQDKAISMIKKITKVKKLLKSKLNKQHRQQRPLSAQNQRKEGQERAQQTVGPESLITEDMPHQRLLCLRNMN